MFFASWKRAAILAAAWGAIVGAMSLIINAIPDLTIILLVVLIPLSLLAPVIIGFITTREYANNSRIELNAAAPNGAISGIVYAIVMVAISLALITLNYAVSSFIWGLSEGFGSFFEVAVQGIIVAIGTLIVGLPVLAIVSMICGAIGGAAYSYIKK